MTSPYLFSRPSECSASRWAYERKILPKIISDSVGKRVYDYGCAAGELRFVLKGESYYGFDVVDYEFDSKLEQNIEFSLDYDQSMAKRFDYCVSSFVFEYVDEDDKVLKDIYDCLEEGSVFWITVPTALIQLYEIPALLYYKLTGKRYYLSGAANEHFYSVSQLQEKLRKAGFEKMEVMQSCGIFTTLLKTLIIYSRLILRQFQKILRTRAVKSPRQFIFFHKIEQYSEYKEKESACLRDKFWASLFGVTIFLDGLLNFRKLNSEFAIRATK